MADKSVSRDLLRLENAAPAASPFLISPSRGPFGGAAAAGAGGEEENQSFPLAAGSGPNGRLKTFPMPPPSALLARVAAFLPQMAAANQQLEQAIKRHGSASVDIENVEDESKPHIEMNLDVGVLEAQRADEHQEIIIPGVSPHAALAAAAAASSSCFASAIAAVAAHAEKVVEDEDENSDDEDADEQQAGAQAQAQTQASSSGLSRAARKKKKYRVRTREKQTTGTTQMDDANAEPLPKCTNPLIQEMED